MEHRVIYKDFQSNYNQIQQQLSDALQEMEGSYAGMKKGVFLSSDTNANAFLNLLIRKYGALPDDFLLMGFDNSPISAEAVIPISTVGQQIDVIAYEAVSLLVQQMEERKKRRPVPLTEPVHKIIAPILIRRETTEK